MSLASMTAPVRAGIERARASFPPIDVAIRTFARYSADDAGTHAAALTYYIFFSVFPLLLAAAAVLGYVTFGNEELRQELIVKGVDSVPLMRNVLDPASLDLIGDNRGLFAFGAIALGIYTGSGAVRGLKHALDHFDGALEQATFWGRLLRPTAWLALFALIGLGSIALSGIAAALEGPLATVAAAAAAFATGALLFATAFKFLPVKGRSWGDVLPGALVAAVAFEVLKLAGGWYLASSAGGRNATFGPFAAAAALLVACSLIARVTLVSAEVNAALAERRATGQASLD